MSLVLYELTKQVWFVNLRHADVNAGANGKARGDGDVFFLTRCHPSLFKDLPSEWYSTPSNSKCASSARSLSLFFRLPLSLVRRTTRLFRSALTARMRWRMLTTLALSRSASSPAASTVATLLSTATLATSVTRVSSLAAVSMWWTAWPVLVLARLPKWWAC